MDMSELRMCIADVRTEEEKEAYDKPMPTFSPAAQGIVVAKGADFMAMRIRRMARKHGVPMVENKPLARSLYRSVKVGKPVPSRFFRAVAELLAYVYRIRKSRRPIESDSVTTMSARSDQ